MTRKLAPFLTRADETGGRAQHIFRSEGVVVLKQVLPASVYAPVRDYLTACVDELTSLFAQYRISIHAPDAGRHVERLLDDDAAAVPPEHRHVLLGHFPLPTRLGRALWAIPMHLDGQPILHDVLGARRLFVHMPPAARFVLPGNSKAAVPAHQDVSYNKHLGLFCVVWVPLVEIDERCGGMAVFPKTQGLGELFEGKTVAAAHGWIPPIRTSDYERVELWPLSPGDIVVMGNETVHESLPNSSDRIRISIDFRFFGENSRSSKHYLDLQEGRIIAPGP
jgi:hypothetical protein